MSKLPKKGAKYLNVQMSNHVLVIRHTPSVKAFEWKRAMDIASGLHPNMYHLGDFLLISRSKRENHEYHHSGLQLIAFDSVVEMDLLSAVFSNQRKDEREF